MNRTVLIVDDDPDFLELLAVYVANAGYRVLKADGAIRALAILEESPPDALVLDIMMPDRTGIEVLEQVRWEARFAKLPVLCISAVTMTDESLEFIREFSVGLLDKANIPEIVDRLKAIVPPGGPATREEPGPAA